MTPFFEAPPLRGGCISFNLIQKTGNSFPEEARFCALSLNQNILMFFGNFFVADFFARKLKGFPMVLQACRSKALAFLLWTHLPNDVVRHLRVRPIAHIVREWRMCVCILCLASALGPSWGHEAPRTYTKSGANSQSIPGRN